MMLCLGKLKNLLSGLFQEEQGSVTQSNFRQLFNRALANCVINIIGLWLQDDIKDKIRELRNSALV